LVAPARARAPAVKSAAQRAEELVAAMLPLRARAADSAMLAPSSLRAAHAHAMEAPGSVAVARAGAAGAPHSFQM
jgi:hypothetical protein